MPPRHPHTAGKGGAAAPGAPPDLSAAPLGMAELQYRTDSRFRRFHEVHQIDVPRLHLQPVYYDAHGQPLQPANGQRVPMRAVLILGGKKTVVNPDGTMQPDLGGAAALKDSFKRYLYTKEAWRKGGLPTWLLGIMSRTGLAPSFQMTSVEAAKTTAAADGEDAAKARKGAAWNQFLALFLIVLAVSIVVYWPVWDSLIDPDANQNYAVLGLQPGASDSAIRKAYRHMAKKWHPDKNPGCGKQCQTMMIQIQDAYNELTKNQDQHALELSQKAKEANGQILAFVGVTMGRVFDVVYQAAEFIVGATNTDTNPWIRTGLRATFHVGVMALFLFEEGFQVGSFVLLLAGGMKLKNILQEAGNNQIFPDYNHVRWEIERYFRWFVVPPTVLFAAWEVNKMHHISQPYLSGLRGMCGALYTVSFVMRHKPYFFINHGLQASCTQDWHPTWRVWRPSPFQISFSGFWKYLIWDVGLDDLLAFAMHVPWAYRASCLSLIFLSMMQRTLYPSVTLRAERGGARGGGQTVYEPLVPWGDPQGWQNTWLEMHGQMQEQQQRETEQTRQATKEKAKQDKRQEREKREAERAMGGQAAMSEKERLEQEKRERKEQKEREQREKEEYVEHADRRRRWTVLLTIGGIALFFGTLWGIDQYMGGGTPLAKEEEPEVYPMHPDAQQWYEEQARMQAEEEWQEQFADWDPSQGPMPRREGDGPRKRERGKEDRGKRRGKGSGGGRQRRPGGG